MLITTGRQCNGLGGVCALWLLSSMLLLSS